LRKIFGVGIQLEKKQRIISATLITLILALSSVVAVNYIQSPKTDSISFIHKEIQSYPGHIAWMLVDLSMNFIEGEETLEMAINTNETIDFDSKLWINSERSGLLELFLYPNQSHLGKIVNVSLEINTADGILEDSAIITIIQWTASNDTVIESMMDCFVQYVEENVSFTHISMNITWDYCGTIPMILIVEHHLFRSENWEMGISRHVTIEPHDWVKAYLRPRNSTKPIWEGIIASWASEIHTITENEPPVELNR
jgi:hypothetical protein